MESEMEDDGETDFRESPESSDTEAEEENKWAQGIKLYFFDEDVWVHYYQGGKAGAVGIWKKDGGASFVQNKSECTHLVINFVHTGVAERDRRASEDMCWAQNNGVGKLQRPIAAHACIAECLSLTGVFLRYSLRFDVVGDEVCARIWHLGLQQR